jgi:hypothetical protein
VGVRRERPASAVDMKLLILTAVAEAATGLALIVVPSIVARLLFDAELDGIAVVVARVAGCALLSLGLACWPGRTRTLAAISGMTVYNVLAAAYLAYLGVRGEWVGVLLWPAVVLHAVLSLLLGRAWCVARTGARDALNDSRHEVG